MGAAIIKFKRHRKYRGFLRRWCNFGVAFIILLLAVADLGYSIYNWFSCRVDTQQVAISAHTGGLLSGKN